MSSNQLTTSIMKKWREQHGMSFVRFLDGNMKNICADNLQWVSVKEAMAHIHDWTTDWDVYLTKRERALVLTEAWRAGLIFRDRQH